MRLKGHSSDPTWPSVHSSMVLSQLIAGERWFVSSEVVNAVDDLRGAHKETHSRLSDSKFRIRELEDLVSSLSFKLKTAEDALRLATEKAGLAKEEAERFSALAESVSKAAELSQKRLDIIREVLGEKGDVI